MSAPQQQQPKQQPRQQHHHHQEVTAATNCRTPTTLPVKRERPFRQKITRQLQLRIYKAQQQRLYLIAIEQQPQPSAAVLHHDQHHNALSIAHQHRQRCNTTFVVLGSTGNVYHVQIRTLPTCSCPDFQSKGGCNCKHIFFVLIKVLQVPLHSCLLYQDAWLPSELETMFKRFPTTTATTTPAAVLQFNETTTTTTNMDIMAAESVQHVYNMEAQKRASSREAPSTNRLPNNNCPICFEHFKTLAVGHPPKTVCCPSHCGTLFHLSCLNLWKNHNRTTTTKPTTCPICRGDWSSSSSFSSTTTKDDGRPDSIFLQYLNFAAIQNPPSTTTTTTPSTTTSTSTSSS